MAAPEIVDSARVARERLALGELSPAAFRAALATIPTLDRDAWIDLVLGLDSPPEDGPELPRGCVPYLPCAIDEVMRVVELAAIAPDDVVVDLGAGVGRAAAIVHLATGASAIGIEIQPALVVAGRALAARVNPSKISIVAGDAVNVVEDHPTGSVFFMYCPFSGERLDRVIAALRSIARTRPIRLCAVDLPLPPVTWLDER